MFNDLLGAKFCYGGTSVEQGFDCWQLCREIYRRLGRELPEFQYVVEDIAKDGKFSYENVNQKIESAKPMFEKLDKPEPYCLVSFFIRPRYTSHVGVVLEDCIHFIHIMEKSSVTIERLDAPEWERRITGFWRYNNATR